MASANAWKPWYADGLAFACQECGGCCRGPGGYVWVTEDEAGALAEVLGMTFNDFAAKLLRTTLSGLALVDGAHGDCPLLGQDGRCRVYNARPVQCRTWPWWRENLTSNQRWDDAATRCPGMNKGRVHSRLIIESEMAKDS